jgi:hypothetical protein
MSPDMQRPAEVNDGPQQQPGQRLDITNTNGGSHCRVEYCKSTQLILFLGGLWCAEHATQYIDHLRRRVARRAAGLPQDAVIGLGIFVHPTSGDWPPSFGHLRCDMCPREWIGPAYEVCSQCKLDLVDALELHTKQHKQRKWGTSHVA